MADKFVSLWFIVLGLLFCGLVFVFVVWDNPPPPILRKWVLLSAVSVLYDAIHKHSAILNVVLISIKNYVIHKNPLLSVDKAQVYQIFAKNLQISKKIT